MDCDATLDPRQLSRVIEPVRNGEVDLMVGRRLPTSARAFPLSLRLANWEVARRVRRRTGVALTDIGPMRSACRRALLELGLVDRRSGYPAETVVRAAEAGWRIAEVAVDYRIRMGRSKVTGTPLGRLACRPRHRVGDRRLAMSDAVIVLAKEPVPGRVKTRLSPAFSPEEAAQLASAALVDTFTAVRASAAPVKVLAWDGDPDDWRAGFALVRQPSDDLAGRLEAAFADTFDQVLAEGRPDDGALLIGMDTPQVVPGLLDVDWDGADALLGLSEDGGFWAIGLQT